MNLQHLREMAGYDRDHYREDDYDAGGWLDGHGAEVLALLNLIAQCKEALEYHQEDARPDSRMHKAIAAIEQWEKK